MQITLLPPLLPNEVAVPVRTGSDTFVPGLKVAATVLATRADTGTLLSLLGREVLTRSHVPHPPGTTLRLEVVTGGAQPLLRLLGAETPIARGASPPSDLPGGGPAVSSTTYGLAAAVFAARGGTDVAAAAALMTPWIPRLVAHGLISGQQGDALLRMLAAVPVRLTTAGTPEAAQATEALARALASQVSEGGLLLERRLADVARQGSRDAERAAARDLRARLAVLADAVADVPEEIAPAREAVRHLQQALLAEQARSAAHLARDGVLDVRMTLQADPASAGVPLRLRIEKDAPHTKDAPADSTPWRQAVLDLALEGLGRVHVRLALAAGQVRAEFSVEEGSAADRIEARLSDLTQALEAAGFAQVLSRVVVDPVRACAPDTMPELPPHHSIVDAQA